MSLRKQRPQRQSGKIKLTSLEALAQLNLSAGEEEEAPRAILRDPAPGAAPSQAKAQPKEKISFEELSPEEQERIIAKRKARQEYYEEKKRQKIAAEDKAWEALLAGKEMFAGRGENAGEEWQNYRKLLRTSLVRHLRDYEIEPQKIAEYEYVVAFDLEFTGRIDDDIMEFGAVKMDLATHRLDYFHKLVKPRNRISSIVKRLTGITNEELRGQEGLRAVLPKFLDFVGDKALIVGHGVAENDLVSINLALDRYRGQENLPKYFTPPYVDTVRLAMSILPQGTTKYNLHALSEQFDCVPKEDHRALTDSVTSLILLQRLLEFGKMKPQQLWTAAEAPAIEKELNKRH